MKPIDYLHLQMELEGIQVCDGNLITRIHPDVENFPLVLYAHTWDQEKVIYFDDMLPSALYYKLAAGDLQSFKIQTTVEEFNIIGINTKVNRFKTYKFPENFKVSKTKNVRCLRRDDPKVVAFGFNRLADEVFAIEQDGKIASACVSSRQNSKSAESWVFTHPDYRRKGLAQQVVMAWAGRMLREDKVPFYSHAVENIGSANLANRLKLVHLYDETVIEKVV